MTVAIGVLCVRVRVEEKQIIAALAAAGVPAVPLPPAALPLPIAPPSPAASPQPPAPITAVIDRCQDRAVAAAVIPVWRSLGVPVLDAGLAATGTRLTVAQALAVAGLPRPATRLVCSEAAALAALDELGYPATLLPLTPGSDEVVLADRDTAEAVLEHRAVLGVAGDAIAILQAGAPDDAERVSFDVVADTVTGVMGPDDLASALAGKTLANQVASVLDASAVGVELALTDAQWVVWDVQPVSEFRYTRSIANGGVARALGALAAALVTDGPPAGRLTEVREVDREVRHGVARSA